MVKKDISFLRKQLKNGDAIQDLYGLYVDSENNVQFEKEISLGNLDESEENRYGDILKTILSTSVGTKAFPTKLAQEQTDLLKLKSERFTENELEDFKYILLDAYDHTDPFYAVVAKMVVDLPVKASDGSTLEDSDYVYSAILCAICPAKLSAPALGLEEQDVKGLERNWVIKKPVMGFVYPALSDGMEDQNEALLFSNAGGQDALFSSVFHVSEDDIPVSTKEQEEKVASLASQIGMDAETAQNFISGISENVKEEDECFSKEEIRTMMDDAGADVSDFDAAYEETVGDTQIQPESLIKKNMTVTMDDTEITVPTDRAGTVRIEEIDGVEYLMLPVNGTVRINGIEIGNN